MAEKLFSYADKQVMEEVGSGGGDSGGGSNTLIVHITGSYGNWAFDKTFDEIVEAVSNGRYVMLATESNQLVANLTTSESGTGTVECVFTSCFATGTSVVVTTFILSQDNTVTVHDATLQL